MVWASINQYNLNYMGKEQFYNMKILIPTGKLIPVTQHPQFEVNHEKIGSSTQNCNAYLCQTTGTFRNYTSVSLIPLILFQKHVQVNFYECAFQRPWTSITWHGTLFLKASVAPPICGEYNVNLLASNSANSSIDFSISGQIQRNSFTRNLLILRQ